MILETLDIKQNDVFIYSENKFDFEKNFRVINKDDKAKKAVPIHFNEVCRYINSSDPKSVIIYRLLTNLPTFKTDIIKYGVMITINGESEVIHFDPIFAIKELEEYVKSNDIVDVRFRIQQVGLLSQISNFGKPNYTEVYAFDLEVIEAKWQNDKVFAELIFAFDEVNFDLSQTKNGFQKIKVEPQRTANRFKKITVEDVKNDLVEEDRNFDAHKMRKLTLLPEPRSNNHSVNHQPLPKANNKFFETEHSGSIKVSEKSNEEGKKSFSSFLKNVKTNSPSQGTFAEGTKSKGNVIDLFKSSQHVQQYVVAREQKQIVLKLKNT
ncbi:MAG: hypothetical protein M0Q21_09400 [Ignavibacteriaceae bacterium]|nr:hypothetical protein [Ignavibacteriaceae bacterium]